MVGTMEGAKTRKRTLLSCQKSYLKVNEFCRAEDQASYKETSSKGASKGKKEANLWKSCHQVCRQIYKTEIGMAKMARKAGNSVIRIRGISAVSPKHWKCYSFLAFARSSVAPLLMKLVKEEIWMQPLIYLVSTYDAHGVAIVKPYIAWGCPNLKSVSELIYKHGWGKINKYIALTDNTLLHLLVNISPFAWKIWFTGAILLEMPQWKR